MTEENVELNKQVEPSPESNFQEIKHVASQNIGSMLKDLQDFEEAITTENIPAIYRIYQGRLHQELKSTANQNHEIDELLMRKLHDSFLAEFPFMKLTKKLSPTMQYYQISTYYHERATIGIDASIPEIFVIPEIEEEWELHQTVDYDPLSLVEQQMDALEAKAITIGEELTETTAELSLLEQQVADKRETSKGFFNRSKSDEDVVELTKKIETLRQHQAELTRFVEDKSQVTNQREQLMKNYQALRLKKAVITKEFRLIARHFTSLSIMNEMIQTFLTAYLTEEIEEVQ